ncbi:TPA: SDR family NAD(P)-dependent oxidoreductase [Candidatus Poribacteria bacterium]|nr:SDR family NAD(P)-dependent oxidoreductase [Candidatus Poribacteria bacterium]
MDWKEKKVLVTGAGGFIGSHLVEKLVGLGAKVRAFVRYNSRNDWGLLEILPEHTQRQIEVVTGDLRDSESVRTVVKDVQIVFHLGASIAIPYSYGNPRDAVETNIIGTLNVLNAVKEYEVEKMIQTSSSEVYGTAIYVPIDEKHPLQAQSPYAASKIAADKLAESFHLSYDLPVATIRPFNTYGPRQSARAVIPSIITQVLSSDIVSLGSLFPTRDFLFVEDTVDGFIKMAESPLTVGEVVNVGTGIEISINDLAKKIMSIIGREAKIVSKDERIRPLASEVKRLVADNTKAKRLMEWEPKISLDNGLGRTIEWISKSLNRYKVGIYNV